MALATTSHSGSRYHKKASCDGFVPERTDSVTVWEGAVRREASRSSGTSSIVVGGETLIAERLVRHLSLQEGAALQALLLVVA